MTISFGLTHEVVNTQVAPVAALSVYYQGYNLFEPLETVQIEMKMLDFSPSNKLIQVFLSIVIGCEYLSLVNTRLRPERQLAQLWGNDRFADQSTLAETLEALTLANLRQLEAATAHICRPCSRTHQHDWRGFLWLDFDLSGLPCGQQAEGGQKGFFSGKKTGSVAN